MQRSECADHEVSEESRVGSARRDLPQKSEVGFCRFSGRNDEGRPGGRPRGR